MKHDNSNSSNEDNDHSYDDKGKDHDGSKATLEIWYIYPENSEIKASNSHNVTNILKELVERTLLNK